MISDYCNQSAIWKHITGHDKYTQPIYSQTNILVRKEQKTRLVRNKSGVQVISNTTLFTNVTVKVDDLIDDMVVIAVSDMAGLNGSIEGYEVML